MHEHFRLLFSLLDLRAPQIIVVGTRWSDLDLYGRIIEQHTNFKPMVRAARDEKGTLYFPQMLTNEVLDQLRKDQGSDIFNAQYMNDPLPSGESASFKKDWFRYEEKPPAIDLTLLVDPAIGGTADHDYFALVVEGLDEKNNLHITDYLYGNWQVSDGIAKIFLLLEKWPSIRRVGVETIAFQKVLKFALEAEMRKRNKFVQIVEIKHHKQSKIDRIQSLQPRYEQGAVMHQNWMRGGELEEELLRFPRGRKRDVADAVSFGLEILKPKFINSPREERELTTLDEILQFQVDQMRKARSEPQVHTYLGSIW